MPPRTSSTNDATLRRMQRRTLLKLGLGSAALMTVVGAGLKLMRPGLRDGRLTHDARTLFSAVAVILDGSLPVSPETRESALSAHLVRLDDAIAQRARTQAEISELVAVLNLPPGRLVLAGLKEPWAEADVADVRAALQDMRRSSILLRRQAYHALRELINASLVRRPVQLGGCGYPGP